MVSRWVPLAEASLHLDDGADLARLLKSGGIRSRAGVLKVTPLLATTIDLRTSAGLSDVIYIGADESKRIENASALTDGRHHISTRGAHFTVFRKGHILEIYIEHTDRHQFTVGVDLGVDFWNNSIIFSESSEAINDNIEAMIRRYAVDIVVEVDVQKSSLQPLSGSKRGPRHLYANEAVYDAMISWFRANPKVGFENGIAKLTQLYAAEGINISESSAKRYYYYLKNGKRPGFS